MATQIKEVEAAYGSPSWFYAMVDAAKDEPMMRVVDMGPALAKAMLDNNFQNRSVRRTKLMQYTSDMVAGKWSLNGEPIIIAKNGRLNDGQHRCLAAIDANATVPVCIMFGLEHDTRLTVDQGGARGAGDYLGMEGVPNASTTAAIARMVIAYEGQRGQSFGNSGGISAGAVRERAETDLALRDAATFAVTNQNYSRTFCAGSVIGFAYYILARISRDDAETFLSRVCRGDGLRMKDPAHTLREKLRGDDRFTRDEKVAMIFKCWNYYRRKMSIPKSSLSKDGPFPALV